MIVKFTRTWEAYQYGKEYDLSDSFANILINEKRIAVKVKDSPASPVVPWISYGDELAKAFTKATQEMAAKADKDAYEPKKTVVENKMVKGK